MNGPAHSVLLIDDEDDVAEDVRHYLGNGYAVRHARDGEAGLKMLDEDTFSCVLLDLLLDGGMQGPDVLSKIRARDSLLPVIVLSKVRKVEALIEILRRGANDYIYKGDELSTLSARVHKALADERRNAACDYRRRRELAEHGSLVGASAALAAIRRQADTLACTDEPVIIQGPTGAGKEVIARRIHDQSRRTHGDFVVVDCTMLEPERAQSELFGHVRGAFTDARADKKGLVEIADGGTLLIDEIGDLSLAVQQKLLRFLNDGTFMRLGGLKTQRVDVRVIAVTHRDIAAMVQQGSFREDLYYRLAGTIVRVPPLRDRPEDIAPLVHHFIERHTRARGAPAPTMSSDLEGALVGYPWPGNVRQLKLAVIGALGRVEDGQILGLEHFPDLGLDRSLHEPPQSTLAAKLDACRREIVGDALRLHNGNISQTAKHLGLTRQGLQGLMRRLDVP